MKKLTLTKRFLSETTTIENTFIDDYMPQAHGDYVKVYLLLLRHLSHSNAELTISYMADLLMNTESDIIRALRYWETKGLITIHCDATGDVCQLALEQIVPLNEKNLKPSPKEAPIPLPKSPSISVSVKTPKKNTKSKGLYNSALQQVLFVTEQYMGKPLSSTDRETIFFFYDDLEFSVDLIEYLVEYCVENGHRSIHYIKQVALNWHEQNIKTVDQAKTQAASRNKNYYSVLKSFGIQGRTITPVEIEFINRWLQEYGFSLEMILEACNRTIAAIHQPSFDYTESILKSWLRDNIHNLEDLKQSDLQFQQRQRQKNEKKISTPKNRFNNFEGRKYNMAELERKLLNSNK